MDLELCIDGAPGTVSRLERGKVNPSKETLFKIAESLELKKEEIVDLFCINDIHNN